jgi:hypothetical protein
MRTIKEIEDDIKIAGTKLHLLKQELSIARADAFIRACGVPEGAEPIVEDFKGVRWLISREVHDTFPRGHKIRKNGQPSEDLQYIYDLEHCRYVQPAA